MQLKRAAELRVPFAVLGTYEHAYFFEDVVYELFRVGLDRDA
jgi:hypothetical protein